MILKRKFNSRHMYILFNEQFSLSYLSDVCGRHVKYTAVIKGYALYGHVIQNLTLPVDIQDPCRTQCVMESRCVAINIGPHFGDHIICELSDSDGTGYPQDLKPRNDFIYIGTEVRVWMKQRRDFEFFFFFFFLRTNFFVSPIRTDAVITHALTMGLALMGIPRKATFVSVDLSTVENSVKQVTHTFYVGYTRNIRLFSTVEYTKFISFV